VYTPSGILGRGKTKLPIVVSFEGVTGIIVDVPAESMRAKESMELSFASVPSQETVWFVWPKKADPTGGAVIQPCNNCCWTCFRTRNVETSYHGMMGHQLEQKGR
jgi:hypothetical protein